MGFVDYIEGHIWVPIVVGVVILALGVVLICCIYRKCRRTNEYERVPLLQSSYSNDIGLGYRIQRESEKQYTIQRGKGLSWSKEKGELGNHEEPAHRDGAVGHFNCKRRSKSKCQRNSCVVFDSAWLNSQFYLRSNSQYGDVQQLDDLGRRTNKYWFRVYDSRSRSYMLMTMNQKSQHLTYPFTKENRKLVKDMLLLQQHPFILPPADIDFMVDQQIVVVLYPICMRGSLKDYIYQSRYTDPWKLKYKTRNRGLNVTQIKCFGKQILMALLFLEEKGFPSHGHVHSGNIIIENNKCRLMGCESNLLCEESKLYPVLRRKVKNNKAAFDVLCFGHLVFEMCAGYELTKAHPDPGDLYNCKNPSVVEVLNFIFPEDKTVGYPSLQEYLLGDMSDRDSESQQLVSELKFFSEVPLTELIKYNFSPISLSKDMKSLIKSVTKGQPMTVTRKATLKRSRSSVIPSPKEKEVNLPRGSSSTQLSASSVPPPPPALAPPPPPVAPPTPGTPASPVSPPPSSGGRSALLGQIRKGTSLKKAVTNDRSAPKV